MIVHLRSETHRFQSANKMKTEGQKQNMKKTEKQAMSIVPINFCFCILYEIYKEKEPKTKIKTQTETFLQCETSTTGIKMQIIRRCITLYF